MCLGRFRFAQLGEAEIEHFHAGVRRDLDVRRFEIAMDDALLVCGFDCLSDLPRDQERLIYRNWSALNPVLECFTIDQLEDQRPLFQAVDGTDVRMIERGEQLRLAFETSQSIGIGRKRLRQHLDCNITLQSRIARSIHFAHSASTDGGDDFIRPEARSNRQRHRYLVGTRAFSSSNQFNTTWISAFAGTPASGPLPAVPATMAPTNRWPSAETSYCRAISLMLSRK